MCRRGWGGGGRGQGQQETRNKSRTKRLGERGGVCRAHTCKYAVTQQVWNSCPHLGNEATSMPTSYSSRQIEHDSARSASVASRFCSRLSVYWLFLERISMLRGWKEVEWNHCIRVAPAAYPSSGGGGCNNVRAREGNGEKLRETTCSVRAMSGGGGEEKKGDTPSTYKSEMRRHVASPHSLPLTAAGGPSSARD